jgi:hypothetical protein
VRLIDDQGDETAPGRIEAIVKPGPLEERYFPYTTVWRRAFRIRFPRTTGDGRDTIATNARWFGLRFAGADGNEQLVWRLQPQDGVSHDALPGHRGPDPDGGTALLQPALE